MRDIMISMPITDIDNMEAGQNLDALVAEKVMRLVVTWDEFDFYHGPNANSSEPLLKHYRVPTIPHDEGAEGVVVPSYSTDIEAALGVVDYLHRQRWVLDMLQDFWEGGAYYRCRVVFKQFNTGLVVEGVASTRPLAICLAALKAVHIDTAPV